MNELEVELQGEDTEEAEGVFYVLYDGLDVDV